MTRVLGIRHGEVYNPEHIIYAGLPGYGLSDLGREQATAAGEALKGAGVTALYASPLDRAVETATIIGEAIGLEPVPDERLQEWGHWHQWAGMTWEQLRDDAKEAWDAYRHDPGSVNSGESLVALADRVQSWLGDAKSQHDGGTIVGVSHLEPLRAILLRLTDRPATDLFDIDIGLAHGVRIAPTPDPDALPPAAIGGALT